jgi:hypothetical protein
MPTLWRRLGPSAPARPIEVQLIGRAAQDLVMQYGTGAWPLREVKARVVGRRVRQALTKQPPAASAAAAGLVVGVVVGLVLAAALTTLIREDPSA